MTTESRRIDDPRWLATVRADLDSNASSWIVKTDPAGISKLQAIGTYLDIILRELGVPRHTHLCPICGAEHEEPTP